MTPIYSYKGKKYYVENYGAMKCQDRQWRECVTYISMETGSRYTRELEDFKNKFKAED